MNECTIQDETEHPDFASKKPECVINSEFIALYTVDSVDNTKLLNWLTYLEILKKIPSELPNFDRTHLIDKLKRELCVNDKDFEIGKIAMHRLIISQEKIDQKI